MQAASPNYGQLVQQVVPASAVLAALHPHEAFVSIVLGDKDGWAFLLRDNTIAIAKVDGGIPRMAKLVHDTRASIELTAAGLPTFNIAAARELYDATLGGFGATALDGETALVVAPSGPLLSIPFEVLLTGPAQPDNLAAAPWLMRKLAIAHVPAPSNFVSLRKIAGDSRATRPWFGFGDFVPPTRRRLSALFPGPACAESAQLFAELPALPFATKELDVARQILGASPSEELLGRAFTAPAVLKTSLKNYRILHFATHALLPSELRCQSEPAIVTSVPPGAACPWRPAHRHRRGRDGPGCQSGHSIGLQFRWPWRHHGGREPVRLGARVLLCWRPQSDGYPLGRERQSGRLSRGGHAGADEG